MPEGTSSSAQLWLFGGAVAVASALLAFLVLRPVAPPGPSIKPTDRFASELQERSGLKADRSAASQRVQIVEGPAADDRPAAHAAPSVAAPSGQSLDSLGAGRLAELQERSDSDPDATAVDFPASAEQREDFISRVLDSRVQHMDEVVRELSEREWARLPPGLDAETAGIAGGFIRDIAQMEFAYRLETSEAIKNEIRTADLSVRKSIPKGSRGQSGSLSVVVQGHPWNERPVRVTAYYLVDFAVHERVRAASESLGRARERYRQFLTTLSVAATKK
jgi:hypothetical protein